MSEREELAKIVRRSGLFNSHWYRAEYPDVIELGMDPVEHYLWLGAYLGRRPSPDFDTEAYAAAHPEISEEGINPLVHYIQSPEGKAARPTPHFGRNLRDKIDTVKAKGRPFGESEEYDVIRAEFDIGYYLVRYRDMARANSVDPIQHYINAGAREGRDPSPHFSTKHYVARYPEVKQSGLNPFYHWLTIGREKGYIAAGFDRFEEMAQVLGRPALEVQALLIERRQSLRDRLEHGKLGEMVTRAAELDPLIALSWPEAFQIKIPPFHSDMNVNRVVATYRLHSLASFRRAKAVICVNRPRWGGARRMEGHLAHALADIHGPEEVVVVITDQGGEKPPEKFAEGCRYVDFASTTADQAPHIKQRLLMEFLRALRPAEVFNVNSRMLWDCMAPYGKQLSATAAIYAVLFCNEQTPLGHWTGYPMRQFYRHFDVLAGVCPDSHALAENLSRTYLMPPGQRAKITVLEAPVDPLIPLAPLPPTLAGRRPQIFWSGRFDRQKRIDIVHALAKAMPHCDFRMWGEPVLDSSFQGLSKPDNVVHKGVYSTFAELPLGECDLWLYTSEWDGVPSILLELSMTGVPIVGSLAGGTGEILREGLSWPVAEIEDVNAYRVAVEAVLADSDDARARARKLREALLSQRTFAAFRDRLCAILPGAKEAADVRV